MLFLYQSFISKKWKCFCDFPDSYQWCLPDDLQVSSQLVYLFWSVLFFLYISKKAGAKQDVGDVRFRCMHVPYCYFAIVSNRLIPSPMIFVHTGVHRHILTWSNVTIISPLKIYVIKNTASAEIIKDVTSKTTKKKHEWGSLEFAILACLTSVWSVFSCHKSEYRSTSFRETLDG